VNPDTGLQSERTVMAWQRTALGLGGVSALLLHHANGRLAGSLAGAAGLIVALGMLVLVEVRHERLGEDDEDAPMGAPAVRGLAAVTVALSLAAVAVVLAPHG
jgi:putative membrane protein